MGLRGLLYGELSLPSTLLEVRGYLTVTSVCHFVNTRSISIDNRNWSSLNQYRQYKAACWLPTDISQWRTADTSFLTAVPSTRGQKPSCYNCMRFEFLTAITIWCSAALLWDVTPCIFVDTRRYPQHSGSSVGIWTTNAKEYVRIYFWSSNRKFQMGARFLFRYELYTIPTS